MGENLKYADPCYTTDFVGQFNLATPPVFDPSFSANAAVGTFSVGVSIQVRKSKGQIAYEAMAAKNTIPLQRSPLFNPALDYTQFLLSAVMPAVLQIFICASAVMAFARDRHSKGHMSRLVRLGQTPIKSMLGKLSPSY